MNCKARYKRHPEKRGQKCNHQAVKDGLCGIHLMTRRFKVVNTPTI